MMAGSEPLAVRLNLGDQGMERPSAHTKARGREKGYSWYLQLKNNVLMVEIAEDPSIEPEELPLVGFGCGGWLYESKEQISLETEASTTRYIEDKVQLAFTLFRDKQLNYLPAITCPCSDLND